jgi:EAL domain-containing protein (putative c-di-GMP-specific phosphodiesterase class I)
MTAQCITDVTAETLESAAKGVGLVPHLQPIVALPEGTTVGFEALARWPSLHNPSPLDVFAYAAAAGQLNDLDQLCINAALQGALTRQLPKGTLLAVNNEPASTYVRRSGNDLLDHAHDELTVMFELTERDLLTHPHALLAKVAALRDDGFTLALDDVGAHPDSLALLDLLAPDVVKLDLRLVQSQPRRGQARILAAVLAHHERTGATILAEGIENDDHLEQALALGATLGQGYKYTAPSTYEGIDRWVPPVQTRSNQPPAGSPFDLLASGVPTRTARKQTLTAFSQHIEEQASDTPDHPMVLTTLQQGQHFTPATRQRYHDLAQSSPLVAVFGRHLPADLGDGVRAVRLSHTDPLSAEWTVLALGAQISVALIARECDDQVNQHRPDQDRRFDFTITYDRALVTAVARNLLDRVV